MRRRTVADRTRAVRVGTAGRGVLWLAVVAAVLVAACPGVALDGRGQGLLGRETPDVGPEQAAGAFREANGLYAEGSHGAAVEVYEAILAGGFHNAEVYYNLANARYMVGDTAQAVLGYERALRLDGSHEDAAANLEFVREQLADRQVRVGGAFSTALERFFRSVSSTSSQLDAPLPGYSEARSSRGCCVPSWLWPSCWS